MAITVSVIVPCFNEAATIGSLLDAVHRQTYPRNQIEVLIADGGSQDGTQAIIENYGREHPELRIHVVANPERRIPSALNRAISASQGEYIIRLDAHSAPEADYIQKCIAVLQDTMAANAGGLWDIQPGGDTWMGRAIAAAAGHPLGAADARYRVSGLPGPVDTVPFGAFRREWLDRTGSFNEALLTNEDYEYNVRIRQAGGVVWFDPEIRSKYIARGTLGELASQYWRYGYWKLRMLLSYPDTLRWRQALPPAFVLSTVLLSLFSIFTPAARQLLAVQLGVYLAVTMISGLEVAFTRREPYLFIGFPLAIWTMHFAWGAGFLWSWMTHRVKDK